MSFGDRVVAERSSAMEVPVRRLAFVSGRVQGVGFRAATAREASRLGVTGHAANLADGRVEVLACGTEYAVLALVEWLEEGPPGARVRSVRVQEAGETDIPPRFEIR